MSVSHFEDLAYSIQEDEVHLQKKEKLSIDLEQIFDEFFSTMSGNNDPEMLAHCFVETEESRQADLTLEKITNSLINSIETLDTGVDEQLGEAIETAVETQNGEVVLIVGNKGAGKSTFVDRFFRLILDRNLKNKCLVLRIDMADSPGDHSTVVPWLTGRLRKEIEKELYRGETPEYEELMGIFFHEYTRWMKGEFKHLYAKDRQEFKIKFGEHIYKMIDTDEYGYIVNLLHRSIRSRKLMPCLIFDNADHFSQEFQESIYQFAQSIFRAMFSFVIIPITDRTLWQLSKSGPFQSFPSKSFYLPVPPTGSILSKRIDFLKKKIEEEKDGKRAEYFLSRGIKVSIENIKAFAVCLEEIFLNTTYISKIVGWLANFDIRRSLEISKRIVTAPSIHIDELVNMYLVQRRLSIPRGRVVRCIIRGSHNYFSEYQSNFIVNVFSIRPDGITSPLLKLSLLRMLADRAIQYGNVSEKYIPIDETEKYFEPMGFSSRNINYALENLLAYRLVEPFDPTADSLENAKKICITPSGRLHVEMALEDDNYTGQMAIRTGFRSSESAEKIREIHDRDSKSSEDWDEIINIFIGYCIEQDKLFVSVPSNPSYQGQQLLRNDLEARFRKTSNMQEKLFPKSP